MRRSCYRSIEDRARTDRRKFVGNLGLYSAAAGGAVLGIPLFGREKPESAKVETNIGEFMRVPKTSHSLPGPFPGVVVKVTDPRSLQAGIFNGKIIAAMIERGITALTGKDLKQSFDLFFDKRDVVGLKV